MSELMCPYCEKPLYVPPVVFAHAEAYGSRSARFRCNECENVVLATVRVRVVVEDPRRCNEKEGDWG